MCKILLVSAQIIGQVAQGFGDPLVGGSLSKASDWRELRSAIEQAKVRVLVRAKGARKLSRSLELGVNLLPSGRAALSDILPTRI
jgi:hypothetical protein